MRAIAWLRRWPITTMLVAVVVAQTIIILAFGVTLAMIRAEITEVAAITEQRATEAQQGSEQRLSDAMGCIIGVNLLPAEARTDEVVHRVCPPELIGDVRARLAPP